ncbi:alkene reductase [Sediminitomix flava]|uniref:2,4-dienoyl-CoA reductase-like NADH-dependent reductase (Old Yellow Enzyme family) n=1 Tax=Sediminitomix flava TaxID=379075 RepID=A0A315Z7R7_SEDFL|nr:alkene reductase [Sediminitomix flava]PWJ40897.1 2,4-dienoyl-CoA reductase-like NADH-dependent reductase (Old Yellow Enzyme family) [Sediminitomix flava]
MTTDKSPLYQETKLGSLELKNRIVMPPMTRSRAGKGDVASEMMAEYYAQRASAGLIVSEGTQISPQGQGYAWTPGIYSDAQIEGWKKVTTAVHNAGGKMFAQLWHVGRISHTALQPNGDAPVSSSALVGEGVKVFIDPENKGAANGVGEMIQHSMPRALTIPEIKDIVEEYAQAAKNAIAAGFDGIELHGANGYLINQFIDSESNNRTDEYGGCLENRLRFMKEVVTAVSEAIGKDRVGIRLAPLTTLNGTVDATPEETYLTAVKVLNDLGITYVHIAEADWEDAPLMPIEFKKALREAFKGTLIYAGKYTKEKAEQAIAEGWADMIAFGRPFIANPDLPYRLEHNLPLNEPKPESFFGGTQKGLIDYPTYQETMKTTNTLFSPLTFNNFKVDNRIAMAPMTRSRTDKGDVPNAMMAKYYKQRATAGLIISEGTPISAVGRGYSMTPGIYTPEQIEGWKLVTKAVHEAGGKIFAQLWHVGRRSHTSIAGEQPVSASAVKDPDKVFGPLPEGGFGMIETDVPRALTVEEIKATTQDFVQAAKNAVEAGFDGVELHGAHGYLIDQFLRIHTNQRTDEYGGSKENRSRFLVETMQAVVDAIGGDKVAIRISPLVTEGIAEPDPEIIDLTLDILKQLTPMNLAYVHFSENISNYQEVTEDFRKAVREVYQNPIMIAGKLTKEAAEEAIAKGYADMAAFGQPFITNPDLVYRFENDLELTPVGYDAHSTFYGGGEEGYTDYPTYQEMKMAEAK